MPHVTFAKENERMGIISQVNKKWEKNDITIKKTAIFHRISIYLIIFASIYYSVKAVNGTDSEAFKTDVSFIHSHLYFLCLITSKSESFSSCPYFHPSLNL